MKTALQLIGLIHKLENFTVDYEVSNPPVDDEEEQAVIEDALNMEGLPTTEVIKSLRGSMDAIKMIIPIARMVEDYLDGDIDNDLFMTKWEQVRDAAESRLEDKAAETIGPEVTAFLQDISTRGNHEPN